MNANQNIEMILEIFRALEERDDSKLLELMDPEFEIHWPRALPYGGSRRGLGNQKVPTWSSTWEPLQPTESERKMSPRVIAAEGDEVVVLYRQRGLSPTGERFDSEVMGLYQFREGKLRRAQMFYFDEAAAVDFLAKASAQL